MLDPMTILMDSDKKQGARERMELQVDGLLAFGRVEDIGGKWTELEKAGGTRHSENRRGKSDKKGGDIWI